MVNYICCFGYFELHPNREQMADNWHSNSLMKSLAQMPTLTKASRTTKPAATYVCWAATWMSRPSSASTVLATMSTASSVPSWSARSTQSSVEKVSEDDPNAAR